MSMPSTTRNYLTFANTTAIACHQNIGAPGSLFLYATAVVFTSVYKLRVPYSSSRTGMKKSEKAAHQQGTGG